MSRFDRLAAATFIVLVSMGALSCTQAVKKNPVQGKVLHKGQPLAGALVSFHPEKATLEADVSTGLTKDDGTFSLVTGQAEGAPAGNYVVTVMHMVPIKTPPGEGMALSQPESEDSLQGAFANRDTSQIKVTVKDGPNQLEPFDLK